MELISKQNNGPTQADLRALVKGQYGGDPDRLLDQVARFLLSDASDQLRKSRSTRGANILASEIAREAIAAALRKLLLTERTVDLAQVDTLPVSKLSPEELLAHTGMSKSTLYRGDHVKFYSVVPTGLQNGRAYPAWQFIRNVPSNLPKVLEVLNRKSRLQVNTFFMSEQDALNELSPAEVIAGLPFCDRGQLEAAQSRMLSMSEKARLDKVISLALLEVADPD